MREDATNGKRLQSCEQDIDNDRKHGRSSSASRMGADSNAPSCRSHRQYCSLRRICITPKTPRIFTVIMSEQRVSAVLSVKAPERLSCSARRVEAVTVEATVEDGEAAVEDPTQTAAPHRKRSRVKPSWIWDVSWTRRLGSSFRAGGRSLVC
jgi:hypothetical protein